MDNKTALFAKSKNINYRFVTELINYMVCNETCLSKEDIDKFDLISRQGMNTEKINKNDFFPAEDTKKEYLFRNEKNGYYPTFESQIPLLLTNAEKDYLKMLVAEPIARCFLSLETIEQLCTSLDISQTEDCSFIELKNIRKVPADFDENKMRENIKHILEAITNNNAVSFTYEGKSVMVMPVRILISARFNTIMLVALPAWSKAVLYNIEKIDEITVTDIKSDNDIKDTLLNKEIKTVLLEIPYNNTVVQTNSVERCLFIFSHLNKSITYDKRKNKYLIELHYYAFEEEELIRDILSFGSNVIVSEKSPEIRNKIIAEITDILSNME